MTATQTATTDNKTRLWVGINGEFVCTEHGGHYLRTAVRNAPDNARHVTPLDDWIEVTERYEAQVFGCEVC